MTDFRLTLMETALSGGDIHIEVIDQSNQPQQRILAVGDTKVLQAEGDAISKMGFDLWSPVIPADIGKTVAGSAAEQAGLLADDRIIAINSQTVSSWKEAVEHISSNPGRPITMTVLRAGNEVTLNITPATRKNSEGKDEGHIGVYLKRPDWIYEKLYTKEVYSPLDAVTVAVAKTWNMSVLTLKVLGRMVIGEAALENISGPISIAQFAGATAGIGLIEFLSFLAVISVSLGVLNLLPVPVLDGGHLLFYLVEFVIGKPLPEKAQQYGQQIGMALLLMLMTVAIFNDLQRLFS
jgi:regulator of sigma E protease